jgi:hypothetical protein
MLGGSPCHYGMARPRVPDGKDSLQHWRLAANILNKQPPTNDKGWSSSLGVGHGTNNPSQKKATTLRKGTMSLGPGRNLWIKDLNEDI